MSTSTKTLPCITTLPKWPSGESFAEPFLKAFTIGEKLNSWSPVQPYERHEVPDFELRKSLAEMASIMNKNLGPENMSLVIFQDENQSSAISLSVREVRRHPNGAPVFPVWYIHQTKAKLAQEGLDTIQSLARDSRKGSLSIRSSIPEQRCLLKLLEKNQSGDSREFSVPEPCLKGCQSSYITVVEAPADFIKPKKYAKKCHVCGSDAPHTCGNCKSAYYCSRACQKKHWKELGHKQICMGAKDALTGRVDSDTKSVVLPAVGPNAKDDLRYGFTISFVSGPSITSKLDKNPTNVHGDSEFIVKVQVPIIPGQDTSILIYDKHKTFQRIMAKEEPGYSDLERTVRRHGAAFGGAKLYFRAKREAGNFRIFLEPLPSQDQRW